MPSLSFLPSPVRSDDSEGNVSRVTPSQDVTEAGTPRKRAQRACRECHAHKTKCSGSQPACARCTNLGILCVYEPSKRKFSSAPGSGPSPSAVTSPQGVAPAYLLKGTANVEAKQLVSPTTSSASPGPSAPTGRLSLTNYLCAEYVPSSSPSSSSSSSSSSACPTNGYWSNGHVPRDACCAYHDGLTSNHILFEHKVSLGSERPRILTSLLIGICWRKKRRSQGTFTFGSSCLGVCPSWPSYIPNQHSCRLSRNGWIQHSGKLSVQSPPASSVQDPGACRNSLKSVPNWSTCTFSETLARLYVVMVVTA